MIKEEIFFLLFKKINLSMKVVRKMVFKQKHSKLKDNINLL